MTTPEQNPQAEAFYAGALVRITRLMPLLAAAATVAVLAGFGWQTAAGFVVGCVLALVNFAWLKRAVIALADRATSTGVSHGGRGVFLRFLLRYALVAGAAYVIFLVSEASLGGLLAGLFLPVAAIACEAAYELYVALRRGL